MTISGRGLGVPPPLPPQGRGRAISVTNISICLLELTLDMRLRVIVKYNTPFFFYAQLLTWEYNRFPFLQSSSPTFRATRCTIWLG